MGRVKCKDEFFEERGGEGVEGVEGDEKGMEDKEEEREFAWGECWDLEKNKIRSVFFVKIWLVLNAGFQNRVNL